jgi:hypothetical protein
VAPPDFVNPYTFVPHVQAPQRGAPASHLALADDRYTGSLSVRLQARTPLLVGGFTTADGVHDVPRRLYGPVMLPGAGLHGAIRSVHEALTGSCLRVVAGDHIPVHRQGAYSGVTRGLTLGVVAAVDAEGLPTRVTRCAQTAWIAHELLATHPSAPFRTGDQLTIPEAAIREDDAGRRKLYPQRPDSDAGVPPSAIGRAAAIGPAVPETWVLLVTDTRARTGPRAWFAVGKIGSDRVPVSPQARDDLAAALVGADDRRPAHEQGPGGPSVDTGPGASPFVNVEWPPRRERDQPPGDVVGERLRVTDKLVIGQPVWVKTGQVDGVSQVIEVRLSQLWRQVGEGSVADRLGDSGPCREPDRLCPSCRVFGSADPTGRTDDEASRQLSYRGHVRVEDAIAVGDVEPLEWELAPLASPKPSAGQFYLDNSLLRDDLQVATNTEPPTANWGSKADIPGSPRPIRGRKFYWRTIPATSDDLRRRSRGHKRDHHTKEMGARTVQLIPSETVFTTTVSFENLTAAELGGLVAALAPARLSQVADLVIAVGGGKPFGFGAVTATIESAQVEDAAMRYLGEAAEVPTLDECVVSFAASSDRGAATTQAKTHWPDLFSALTLGYLADELVWYPPGTGVRGTPEYDQGFEFWKKSSGASVTEKVRGVKYLEKRHLVGPKSPSDPAGQQAIRLMVTREPAPERGQRA